MSAICLVAICAIAMPCNWQCSGTTRFLKYWPFHSIHYLFSSRLSSMVKIFSSKKKHTQRKHVLDGHVCTKHALARHRYSQKSPGAQFTAVKSMSIAEETAALTATPLTLAICTIAPKPHSTSLAGKVEDSIRLARCRAKKRGNKRLSYITWKRGQMQPCCLKKCSRHASADLPHKQEKELTVFLLSEDHILCETRSNSQNLLLLSYIRITKLYISLTSCGVMIPGTLSLKSCVCFPSIKALAFR